MDIRRGGVTDVTSNLPVDTAARATYPGAPEQH